MRWKTMWSTYMTDDGKQWFAIWEQRGRRVRHHRALEVVSKAKPEKDQA